MRYMTCDWDGTGLLGMPADYVTRVIPEMHEEERLRLENAKPG